MKLKLASLSLGLAAGFALLAGVTLAEDAKPDAVKNSIQNDQRAALRFLGIRLERERRLLKRGSEDEAVKLEAECLRQEAKCLERYLWYMKQDHKLAAKSKAVATALDELKKKDAKASLADRKKAGFKVSDLVSNPLGLADAAPPEEKKMQSLTFDATPSATVNKPSRPASTEANSRFKDAKPPPGADAPHEAGSAGSAGSFTDHW